MTTNPSEPSIPAPDEPNMRWDKNKGAIPAAVLTHSSNANYTNGPVGTMSNMNQTINNNFYGDVPNMSVRVSNALLGRYSMR